MNGLMPLLEGIEVKGARFHSTYTSDILMLRYACLNEAVHLGEIGGERRDLCPRSVPSLDEGFARAVRRHQGRWPKTQALPAAMTNRFLNMIRSAAIDDLNKTTLKPLLPSWIQNDCR